MRTLLLLALAATLPVVAGLATATAAPPSVTAAALAADVAAARPIEPVCRGCGCRGGPGYRLANGKCASWGRR